MIKLRNLFLKKLPASTLVETIVASVIFMIIFVMAMDTMTRLLASESGDVGYVVMENDINKCRKQISSSELRNEKRTYLYEWGEIDVEISNYKENVYQIDMVARSNKKHHQIIYRFLQTNT